MLCGFTPFWDGGSPMKIYENILKSRVKYPPYIHPDAHDLLQKLITPDLTKRLGNLHGGSKDVMNHPWFAEVTWDRLQKKDIDAPYVPPVRAGVGEGAVEDSFDIDDYIRWRLLEGLDDISITLGHEADIAAFEATRPSFKPVTL